MKRAVTITSITSRHDRNGGSCSLNRTRLIVLDRRRQMESTPVGTVILALSLIASALMGCRDHRVALDSCHVWLVLGCASGAQVSEGLSRVPSAALVRGGVRWAGSHGWPSAGRRRPSSNTSGRAQPETSSKQPRDALTTGVRNSRWDHAYRGIITTSTVWETVSISRSSSERSSGSTARLLMAGPTSAVTPPKPSCHRDRRLAAVLQPPPHPRRLRPLTALPHG